MGASRFPTVSKTGERTAVVCGDDSLLVNGRDGCARCRRHLDRTEGLRICRERHGRRKQCDRVTHTCDMSSYGHENVETESGDERTVDAAVRVEKADESCCMV